MAAKSLSSKVNGIAAAPRPVLAQQKQQQPAAASALLVECADGPRGMKLKTRKVRIAAQAKAASKLTLAAREQTGCRRHALFGRCIHPRAQAAIETCSSCSSHPVGREWSTA